MDKEAVDNVDSITVKYEAKIAAETISGKKDSVDYMAMPAVAFTDLSWLVVSRLLCRGMS